jgi:hypothetical protein
LARSQGSGSLARPAALAVLAAGYLGVLAADWPGHLTYDSVIQLLDGRTGRYHLWHPPVMAWLMGLADAVARGAGLFMALNALLAFGSFAGLLFLRRRISWAAVAAAALIAASPLVLIYQGFVWKDVLFANATLAGFTALAFSVRLPRGLAALAIVKGFLLLTLAALVRQNGALVLPAGALAVYLAQVRAKGPRVRGRALAVAVTGLVAAGGLAVWATGALYARRVDDVGAGVQARYVQVYDVIGAATRDPFVSFAPFGPEGAAALRRATPLYTPQRIDPLTADAGFQAATENAPAVAKAWSDVLSRHTRAYLAHRLDVFRWMAAPPDVTRCAVAPVGLDGPPATLKALGLTPRLSARDRTMKAYAGLFYRTPVFSHVPYAVVALALAFVFLVRSREPADAVVGVMMAASLVFAASFLAIGLACDYRYLYVVDLTAMAGALYWAAGLGSRRGPPPSRR